MRNVSNFLTATNTGQGAHGHHLSEAGRDRSGPLKGALGDLQGLAERPRRLLRQVPPQPLQDRQARQGGKHYIYAFYIYNVIGERGREAGEGAEGEARAEAQGEGAGGRGEEAEGQEEGREGQAVLRIAPGGEGLEG